jgi:hypothetical protein
MRPVSLEMVGRARCSAGSVAPRRAACGELVTGIIVLPYCAAAAGLERRRGAGYAPRPKLSTRSCARRNKGMAGNDLQRCL